MAARRSLLLPDSRQRGGRAAVPAVPPGHGRPPAEAAPGSARPGGLCQRRQQARYTDTLLATIPRTDGGRDWSRATGYLLEQLPAHAAAGGRFDELHRLLTDFAWLRAKLAGTDITAVIADYDLATDPDLQLIQAALRLSAPGLVRDPGQLPGQLVGRLLAHPQPTINHFVEQIRSWRGQPWLCPRSASLTPSGGPLQHILTGHTGWVESVAVTADGTRAVSGGEDGTVRVWDLATGRSRASSPATPAGWRRWRSPRTGPRRSAAARTARCGCGT